MKQRRGAKCLAAMTIAILVGCAGVSLGDGTGKSYSLGPYEVRTFSSGEIGKDGYSAGLEVSVEGKVVFRKDNPNATADIRLSGSSVKLDGQCLSFCYGEVSDGLEDAYIYAVRICDGKATEAKATVVDDEGLPVLVPGKIPEDWDRAATEEGIRKTFSEIYSRTGK